MKTYNVLMTVTQYVVTQGKDANDAAMNAWHEFREGKHTISRYPEFTCDECDAEDKE